MIRSISATGLRLKSSRVDRVDGVADMPGTYASGSGPRRLSCPSVIVVVVVVLVLPARVLVLLLVFVVRVFVGVLEVVRLV